ncbi:LSU rRNA pseudouridine(1911/1915/1917) synthase (EC [Olavius algarvensis associated proteobacterium Delta 3]|nr:LSU rRNA pseudouridine(1911/1915/1917) synthase (EC [Olavius algarvensis associated proteobacterium Delta 3]CAB5153194.1 LSU rRNA pseudouridine(1911/1915/1917) synthase (EC [Olavius algarvensis associated proteobacterium Delta 3]
MKTNDLFTCCARAEEEGWRLDVFVAARIPDMSRSHAGSLIRNGRIRVDGMPKRPSYRMRADDRVTVDDLPPEPVELRPEPISLEILYQDQDLVLVNKPPGLVVHPAPGHEDGTLVNALLYHCPDIDGIGGELRPGIVHRLDRDTSGVLVAAKNDRTLAALAGQFENRTVRKTYLALVVGDVSDDSGSVSLPIGRHPKDRKKMSIASHRPRDARTDWRVTERFQNVTLLEVDLRTGRTHQIRVHCAAMHHPVVGDPVYTGKQARRLEPAVRTLIEPIRRQMLHALSLEFEHPGTGKKMMIEANMPEDMAVLLEGLRELSTQERT